MAGTRNKGRKTVSGKGRSARARSAPRTIALVATRKGAWIFHADAARRTWRADGPHFLGHNVSHLVLDPRDGRTLLAAAKTGHLGPTVFRSTDLGKSWKEAAKPPAFAKAPEGQTGRSVEHTFWLAPGRAQDKDLWYAGTSPQGLFRSTDGGISWEPFSIINDDPQFREWMGTVQDGTPDGPKLHSIIVDPRDGEHLYLGMSGGGVHETTDGGRSWQTLIKGMDVVEGFGFDPAKPTFHDPHCMRLCATNPDRLYQQNHCGIYRHRPPLRHLAAHRTQHAEDGRRHRLSARRAPAQREHRLGVPDGRHPGLAAHQPRRQAGGLRHAQRRQDLAAARRRPAEEPGVVDGEAPVHGRRRLRFGRALRRQQPGRTVARPRRGPALVLHRAPSARNLRRRDRRASLNAMKVLIPSALRSYTERGETEASGATLAALLTDLDQQYSGIRFRIIDEQDRIRRHIRIFVNGEQARDLSRPLAAADEVVIVQALSGG